MKQWKSIAAAGGALAVLTGVLAAVLITAPKKPQEEVSLPADFLDDDEEIYVLSNRSADSVLEIDVKNENGGYTLTRTGDEGAYSWNLSELLEVTPDSDAVSRFVSRIATLSAVNVVEESPSDLAKYGLDDPLATLSVTFEDADMQISFGMRNPSKEMNVYCLEGGKVLQMEYSEEYFSDARIFAQLVLTDEYDPETTGEPDRISITRADLPEPVEIRYMSRLENASDDMVISTENKFECISPVKAEIASDSLCYGLCGLRMSSCAFLEKSAENIKLCGLDNPHTTVNFSFNGKDRILILGNETDGGYYAALEDTAGIFVLSAERAPWRTFKLSEVVSKRPLTPYIYACSSVLITTPDEQYEFKIDAENKTFSLDGKAVDENGFKKLFERLAGSYGEELFTEQTNGDIALTVRFNYTGKYQSVYGRTYDEVIFHSFDGRKYIVDINGKTSFKTNSAYVSEIVGAARELSVNL